MGFALFLFSLLLAGVANAALSWRMIFRPRRIRTSGQPSCGQCGQDLPRDSDADTCGACGSPLLAVGVIVDKREIYQRSNRTIALWALSAAYVLVGLLVAGILRALG